MEDDDDELNLGACCACGQIKPDVRNVMMLDYRAPVPGTGWGCIVCGLPTDGAVAVLCDECLLTHAEIKFVYSGKNNRVSISNLKDEFHHDRSKHPELRADGFSHSFDSDIFGDDEDL